LDKKAKLAAGRNTKAAPTSLGGVTFGTLQGTLPIGVGYSRKRCLMYWNLVTNCF